MEPGQGDGIATIRLNPFSCSFWDQRWGDDHAILPEFGNLAVQSVTGWARDILELWEAGLVAQASPALPPLLILYVDSQAMSIF